MARGGRGSQRPSRGQFRGRAQHRGRGRGRGGARSGRGAATQSVQRDSFKTSRVQETEDLAESESSSLDDSPFEDEKDVAEDSQSESENEISNPRRSYAALLQVLKDERSPQEPARKKRKLDTRTSGGEHDKQAKDEMDDGIIDGVAEETAVLAEEIEEEVDMNINGVADENEDSDDENLVSNDPFEQHFAGITGDVLNAGISARSKKETQSHNLAAGLKKQTTTYDSPAASVTQNIRSIANLHIKGRLRDTGTDLFKELNIAQKDVLAEISSYRDVHFGHRTLENTTSLREVACLHALNHVFKTRDRVLRNNAKLHQSEGDNSLDLRDQGFTRPKVLIIVPTKQACVRFAESIVKISAPEQQENKSRFWDTFSQEDDDTWESKTDDFQELFGGNHEEDFRVGLKFTRKTIKYFSGFYNSDIIFGSALGLMRTITTGGGDKEKKKSHDADFLSSIEIIIVDNAAAIQMQNFQHLEYVLTQLNKLPKDSHGCDFARVRNWYLDGNAKHLRQTILFTAYHTPELNSLFSNHTHNITGLVKYTPTYVGSMLSLPHSLASITIPQNFLRFDSPSPTNDSDARFKFFTTTILPSLLRHNTKGVLIFISTYFDFVRLRNHFSTSQETTSLSFGSVSEYSSVRDTARARSHFMNAKHNVLIYSERAHHHFRYRIRGVRRVVFYGVPENPLFWGEIVALLALSEHGVEADGKGGKGLVRALFSRWDVLKLERIVGTERVGKLIHDRGGDTFEFV